MVQSITQHPIVQQHRTSSTYHHISSSSSRYHSILFQAWCLQTIMFRYSPELQFPLQNPSVYLSFDIAELPIVINTGVSFSITPTATGFTQKIVPSSCTSRNQLSSKTTAIGEGPIKWDKEDVTGACCKLKTQSYYKHSLGNTDETTTSVDSRTTGICNI